MKKIIALMLSLLMLVAVCLTGCSKKTEEEAVGEMGHEGSKTARTLSMYLMCEEEMSEETKTMITDAVNQITESKFKTRMVLYFYTEAEYYEKLEKAFADREEARLNDDLMADEDEEEVEETTAPVGDETEKNELGQVVIKYPAIKDYQVDIFYLGGQDKFMQYKKAGLLAQLDGQLSDASKKLNQYIFPQYLSTIKALNGATYAIPNNRTIGEYTYMLLNKEALNETYRRTEGGATTYEEYLSITGQHCKDFLDQVDKYLSDDFYPIYREEGITEIDMLSNLQFVGCDATGTTVSDEFSLVGGFYDKNQTFKNGYAELTNLFENDEFKSALETLVEYKERGYYNAEAGKKFAVGYVKGGAELAEQYSDEYEVVVIETPRLDEAGLYDHCFAVNANTSDLARSMQIVTMLNTDETLRNLLLYGVEGEHYQVVDTGIVKNELGDTYKVARRLNNDYMMDVNKTGNAFISLPLEAEEVLPAIYSYGVKQNQDATVKLSIGFGFKYNADKKAFDIDFDKEYTLNQSTAKRLRELSQQFLEGYLACDTLEEYEEYMSKMTATLVTDTRTRRILNNSANYDHGIASTGDGEAACKKTCGFLGCVYEGYLKSVGAITK